MATQTNIIMIGAIGLALVVALFLIFRNLDPSKVVEDISKGFDKFVEDTGKGFEEFANNTSEGINSFIGDTSKGFDNFFNNVADSSEESKITRATQETFVRQLEAKTQQAKDAGFGSVESFEKFTDPNSIFNAISDDDLRKFNPPNTIGFGISFFADGKGVEDTEKNRRILRDFLVAGENQVISSSARVQDFNLANPFSVPQAFGETFPETQTVIQLPSADRPLSLSAFVKPRPSSKLRTPSKSITRITAVRGTAKSEIDSNQSFQVFGITRGNRKVTGVIRKTKQDPRKLRTNSNKTPTETASQRANRVFIETGKFAGEGRGFNITKNFVS